MLRKNSTTSSDDISFLEEKKIQVENPNLPKLSDSNLTLPDLFLDSMKKIENNINEFKKKKTEYINNLNEINNKKLTDK